MDLPVAKVKAEGKRQKEKGWQKATGNRATHKGEASGKSLLHRQQ